MRLDELFKILKLSICHYLTVSKNITSPQNKRNNMWQNGRLPSPLWPLPSFWTALKALYEWLKIIQWTELKKLD